MTVYKERMNKERCVHTLLVEAQSAQEVGVRTHEVGGNSIIAKKKYKREEVT